MSGHATAPSAALEYARRPLSRRRFFRGHELVSVASAMAPPRPEHQPALPPPALSLSGCDSSSSGLQPSGRRESPTVGSPELARDCLATRYVYPMSNPPSLDYTNKQGLAGRCSPDRTLGIGQMPPGTHLLKICKECPVQ